MIVITNSKSWRERAIQAVCSDIVTNTLLGSMYINKQLKVNYIHNRHYFQLIITAFEPHNSIIANTTSNSLQAYSYSITLQAYLDISL